MKYLQCVNHILFSLSFQIITKNTILQFYFIFCSISRGKILICKSGELSLWWVKCDNIYAEICGSLCKAHVFCHLTTYTVKFEISLAFEYCHIHWILMTYLCWKDLIIFSKLVESGLLWVNSWYSRKSKVKE